MGAPLPCGVAARACGKAMLFGEYAVLDGAAAIVGSVGRYAVARLAPDGVAASVFVEEALRAAHAWLAARGRALPAGVPLVDSAALHAAGSAAAGRKLGLGSSAAVTVAAFGAALEGGGIDLDALSPEERAALFAPLDEAHARAQGVRGSGLDVAAALWGGVLRRAPLDAGARARGDTARTPPNRDTAGAAATTPGDTAGAPPPRVAVAAPLTTAPSAPGLALVLVDTGVAASTADRVARYRGLDRGRAEHAALVAALARLADGFSLADPLDLIAAAVAEWNARLVELASAIGVEIVTPAHARIAALAAEQGAAAKPSGAGGGDLAVCFVGAADREALVRRLRTDGFAVLDADVGVPGLSRLPPVPGDTMTLRTSRLPGFYKLTVEGRRRELASRTGLVDPLERLGRGALLDAETADHMSENVIGTHALPLGVGLNFRMNGKDYLVPMAVEEPSVVAAASNAARMARAGGGFSAEADDPIMIAQVQLVRVADTEHAKRRIEAHASEIVRLADEAQPGLVARGGGTRGIEVRVLDPSSDGTPGMLVVHLHVDCRDAMGANLVNTIAEVVADRLAELSGGEVALRILSNLADRRCARARCRVPVAVLATGPTRDGDGHDGARVADGIVAASRFAELDPYRAATHNKGVMNGVDAVVLATGNDWRGVEAGAHAFAARSGTYRPLATWRLAKDDPATLEGQIELPMALGTVGGATRVHPGAQLALALVDVGSAAELGMIIACVGLASNLAALRALASEGIQRGHMSLHARTVARSAGATGEMVERVAAELARTGDVRAARAVAILESLRAAAAPSAASGTVPHGQGARS